MLTIKISKLCGFFFVILLTTEFFHIQVGAGVARVYHLLAALVVLCLLRYIPRLFQSSVFLALSAFLAVNFLASVYVDYPNVDALSSFLSVAANAGVALAVALILVSGRYGLEQLLGLILNVSVVAIAWGFIQLVSYKYAGVNLALSEQQSTQIATGFAPAFRTEANTFAKYLNFVFLLFLPKLLIANNNKKALSVVLVLFVGMLMCFTRSALYGLSITLVIVYLWYLSTGRGRLISPRVIVFVALSGGVLFWFSSQAGGFNEYAAHKIATFFDSEEILGGGSSGFRLFSQDVLIEAFLMDPQSILLGNGWGQVFFDYGGERWQAGGAEILTALAYGGILSGLFYLAYVFSALNTTRRMAVYHEGSGDSASYEGLMFAVTGSFVTGQINGAMIAPEYWLMYGMAMYAGYRWQFEARLTKKDGGYQFQ